MTIDKIKEIARGMTHSFEILPPLIENNTEKVIGLTIDKTNRTITIWYAECIERHGDDRYKSPNYYKNDSICFPIELLSWLAPRLGSLRECFNVPNNFEQKNKPLQ